MRFFGVEFSKHIIYQDLGNKSLLVSHKGVLIDQEMSRSINRAKNLYCCIKRQMDFSNKIFPFLMHSDSLEISRNHDNNSAPQFGFKS